jgi:hypothetical protein
VSYLLVLISSVRCLLRWPWRWPGEDASAPFEPLRILGAALVSIINYRRFLA